MTIRTTATSNIARGVAALGLALLAATALAGTSLAHATPKRAVPPIDGAVATAPTQVEIWFSEEATSATTIEVFGPDGVRVDLGDAKLDLQDAQRVHAIVSLLNHLDPGVYRVEWNSVSGLDGDAANGTYSFTIGAATPAASPATAVVAADLTPTLVTTPVPVQFQTSKVDDRALSIGIAAGGVAAVAIFLFWRWMRPKNPVF